MTHETMIQLAATCAALLLPSLFTAICPHPSEVQRGLFRSLLLVLGRLSVLRHGDSPGTLHVPLTAQPAPEPECAEPRCAECSGTAGMGGKIEHAPACGSVPAASSPRLADVFEGSTLPDIPSMVTAQKISGAGLALVLVGALALSGCSGRARYVVAQGLVSDRALAQEVTGYVTRTEKRITATSRTREEAERRDVDLHEVRDLMVKLLERSAQNLRDVARALDITVEDPAPAAPLPAHPVGGAR